MISLRKWGYDFPQKSMCLSEQQCSKTFLCEIFTVWSDKPPSADSIVNWHRSHVSSSSTNFLKPPVPFRIGQFYTTLMAEVTSAIGKWLLVECGHFGRTAVQVGSDPSPSLELPTLAKAGKGTMRVKERMKLGREETDWAGRMIQRRQYVPDPIPSFYCLHCPLSLLWLTLA